MADVCRVSCVVCRGDALVLAIACSSMTPPHKIRLWRIDDFEDNEKGLVLLQDPTQKLADAGITSNAAVLYELPDARNGYLRPCRSSTLPATANNVRTSGFDLCVLRVRVRLCG